MRVAFHTLGCKVNQYETEAIKEAFVSRGAEIVAEDACADVYVVNTCTVTNIADRKSRQYIRRMKAVNPWAFVVVTGCYAQVEAEEVASIPEVNLVMGNGLKSRLCDAVISRLESGFNPADCEKAEIIVLERKQLDYFENMGTVVSSESGMTRAYIKIQEGCDRFCAYCLIPFARGPVRSRPPEEILKEAAVLLDSGYRELVLTGINTALYGTEPSFCFASQPGEDGLTPLEVILKRLDAIDLDFRIRLSSLEPTVVDKEHVERIIRYRKLCHHLHLSVQSGSSSVLKTMNRQYSREDYLDIVKAIREYDPLYGITSDVIVGFSGESETDFRDSMDIVAQSEFAKTHIFRYSPRKGTVGESLPDAVPGTVKADRAAALAELAEQTAEKFFEKNFDICHTVLTEERVDNYVTGYTDNYIRVYIEDAEQGIALGEFCRVQLDSLYRDGCRAKIIK